MKIREDLNWSKIYSIIVEKIGKPCLYIYCTNKAITREMIEESFGFQKENTEKFFVSKIVASDTILIEFDSLDECKEMYSKVNATNFYAAVFCEKGKLIFAHN